MRDARTGTTVVAALLALGALMPSAADAAEREQGGAITLTGNPLGLQLRLTAGRRVSLTKSASPLVKDAHLAAGLTQHLTPAYARTEAWLRLAPLSILELRGNVQAVGYFGTFGNVMPFASYDADFSDAARKSRKNEAGSAFGWAGGVSATLKAAKGRVAFRSTGEVEWWSLDAPAPYFYEPSRATLMAAGGDRVFVLTSHAVLDLSHDRSRARTVGLMHEILRVRGAPQNQRQKLGVTGSFRVGERRAGLRQPTVALGVLHYLESPDRSGVMAFVSLSFRLGGEPAPHR